jgi:quercetin dioxygenase-like cupin family protein
MSMNGKRIGKGITAAIFVIVAVLYVSVHSATPNILVEGTIADSKVFDGPVKLTVRELTMKPGEELPWHYHPGHAFNVVKSGTLTVDDGCGGVQTLTPGQGFEEMNGRVHRGKNAGATDVVVYDTFYTSVGKPTTVNIPGNVPRCGPPKDTDECKSEGWRRFNHPRNFTNQQQCLDFVRHMPQPLSQM